MLFRSRPTDAARTYEKPGPIIVSKGTKEYEVDEVINHRKRKRGRKTKIEYLIVWKEYPVHYSHPSLRIVLPSTRL